MAIKDVDAIRAGDGIVARSTNHIFDRNQRCIVGAGKQSFTCCEVNIPTTATVREIDRVRASATISNMPDGSEANAHDIIAVFAIHRVNAVSTKDDIVASATIERVIASAAVNDVITSARQNDVCICATGDRICTIAGNHIFDADQRDRPRTTRRVIERACGEINDRIYRIDETRIKRIGACTAIHKLASCTGPAEVDQERVIAIFAIHLVDATATIDGVIPATRKDDVITRAAVNRIAAAAKNGQYVCTRTTDNLRISANRQVLDAGIGVPNASRNSLLTG